MDYDICYIGGGLNYAGAVVAAKAGLKVALIERDLEQLGGVCLHKGCIPSKMFLHHALTVMQSRDDLFDGDISLDMAVLLSKKKALIDASTKAVTRQCGKVDLIEGRGYIVKPYTIEISSSDKSETISAKYVVVGTGSKPFIPDGIEYDGTNIITSDEVLSMDRLPDSIAVYGNGAIGLEMATFFAACGVNVTLIYRHDTVMKKAHPLVASAMEKQLDDIGIKRLPSHPIKSAKQTKRGVHIVFEDKTSIYTPKLLVATGRHPNTEAVRCDEIEVARKGIVTDDSFETTLNNHYAIGDCNGKLQLAHAARAEALYVTQKIVGSNPETVDLNRVVKFIHTMPMSYAMVGKTAKMVENSGSEYKDGIAMLNTFTYSAIHNAQNGVMIVYADDEGFIAGAEILAPNAEELISAVAMAIAGELDISLAKDTILAHPTFSEALQSAFHRL